jgi:hypothetical protein
VATLLHHQRLERTTGIEPVAFDLASRRSNRLSYVHPEPPRGIEPRTFCLPCRRSCRLSYGGEIVQADRAGIEPANP